MTPEDLKAEIISTLVEVVPEVDSEKLDARASFRDQYSIDSIDYLEFVMALEKKFKLTIPESDFPKLSSLTGCMDYLTAFDLLQVDTRGAGG